MGKKIDGQGVMLIVNIVLILMLSYCSIPDKHKLPQASEPHGTEAVTQDAAVHDNAQEAVAEVKEAAEVEAPVVEEKEPVAEVKEPVAEVEETVAEVEEPAAEEKEPAAEVEAPAVAQTTSGMPDVIAMENAIYAAHKKGIVQFTHQKHVADYKIGCGECHHGDDGSPLADMKAGDDAVGCAECHAEPGTAPKSKDKKLSDSEKLEYHAEALHENCITCHKAYNKENNTKDAPASCAKCHPKK
ncbi:conserved hypothetical protein [Desulforapulum autotrophicum HRM2]|uniref:Class III cytochrome C domain-containing protein n=1 Tax=Desulforapulum autotrophicum (strain ATCC 43914 / DSM 3382 / VKM B-1955 / HRM2) TaxID=177437 RepID=C0QC90_DESAH|nr:cytochrome c3 family protein [Desulforapulum autotrophicum]ACN17107.1 conserved hypothetical protein [Desulforapulum autotrophicum HRM2]